MANERFDLAPLAGVLRVLTYLSLALPVGFLGSGYLAAAVGNSGVVVPLGIATIFLVAIYLLIWVYYRPTYFELRHDGLLIKWPIRQRVYPYSVLGKPEVMDNKTFESRYGRGMRVGAGGLWGGFGLLVCRKTTFHFYISRLDGIVVAEAEPRPLMITPERPEQFAQALVRRLGL